MKIAILGGSFDPAGLHHLTIIKEVLKLNYFNEIIVLPCGPRPDKKSVQDIDPVHRAAMLEMTFRALKGKITIELNDLEKDVFTRTIDVENRYNDKGQVWHVAGYDLVEGGRVGKSVIQKEWMDGNSLWEKSRFVVVMRKNYIFNEKDLPPQSKIIQTEIEGSSTLIRTRRFNHQTIGNLVVPEVADYIERYNLYRGRFPLRQTLYTPKSPRLLIVADEKNTKALAIKEKLQKFSCEQHPNLIVDIGGDGNKLRAIRKYWHLRLPFFGINAGHRGYLLNDMQPKDLFPLNKDLIVHHLPLLQVDIQLVDGSCKKMLGFNEAWMERASGQSAWLEVIWNKVHRIPKVVGDGLMVSTAAGSTGYAQNISGYSLPTHVKELLLVGMAISEPVGWRNAIFSENSIFEILSLDNSKRPVRAFVDGIYQGNIEKMRIGASKIASVELAFVKGFDISAKHTKIQLPYFQAI